MNNWTKFYLITQPQRQSKFYLTSNVNGYFYGMIIYVKRTGNWSDSNLIDIEIKDVWFYDTTEDTVYNAAMTWISANLPGESQVDLIEVRYPTAAIRG